MKWISYILFIFTSFNSFSQELTRFESLVFRETTLGYDEIEKKLLLPTENKPYKKCSFEDEPKRYECSGGGVTSSKSYIAKGGRPGDFKVDVFHPAEERADTGTTVSTFVKNGKVIQQSRCFYDDIYKAHKNSKKAHSIVTNLECYVATPKLCNVLNKIKSVTELKDKELFRDFLAVLKSEEYKQMVSRVHKQNYRSIFLNINRKNYYPYYSKLEKSVYRPSKEGVAKSTRIVDFEDSLIVKQSKNLYDVVARAKTLLKRVFFEPCIDLAHNNLWADAEVEYVDTLEGDTSDNLKTEQK